MFADAVDKGITATVQKSDLRHCTAVALDLNSTIHFELDKLKPSKEGSWENHVFGVVAEIKNRNLNVDDFNFIFKEYQT